jgi:hypothetical protein
MKILTASRGWLRHIIPKSVILTAALFVFGCGSTTDDQTRSIRLPSQKPVATDTAVDEGDLYAVVVGLSKYRHPDIPKLKFADKDAKDFGDFLDNQKRLFRNVHLTRLINEDATRQKVEEQLFYGLRRAGKADTVLLFFAGHGADDPAAPGEFFFLTYDADPKIPQASSVNMSKAGFMSRLDSKRVLLIADTCHSGGYSVHATRSVEPAFESFKRQLKESEGMIVLSASKSNEIALEKTELGNGVFTHYLLKGLKGAAEVDKEGRVTLPALYKYVYEKTIQETGGLQHPPKGSREVGLFPMSLVKLPDGQTVASLPHKPSPDSAPLQQQPGELGRLRAQAEGGDAKAQFELGLKYEYGLGVSKDNAEALKWYSKASEKGNGDARSAMARLTPAREPSPISNHRPPGRTSSSAVMKRDHSKDKALLEAEGKVNDVYRLLSGGAREQVNKYGRHVAMYWAVREGHIPTIQLLLDQGTDINAKIEPGFTALSWAAYIRQPAVLAFLLDHGAYVDSDGGTGTALRWAASYGNTKMTQLLIDSGADVNAFHEHKGTPLDAAISNSHWETAKTLQDRGAKRSQLRDKPPATAYRQGEDFVGFAGPDVYRGGFPGKPDTVPKNKQKPDAAVMPYGPFRTLHENWLQRNRFIEEK